jgi:hypothetical protein
MVLMMNKTKMIVSPKQAAMLIRDGRMVQVCYRRGKVDTYGQTCETIEQLEAALEVKGCGATVVFVDCAGVA